MMSASTIKITRPTADTLLWNATSVLIAALALAPILALAWFAIDPPASGAPRDATPWARLLQTILPGMTARSLALAAGAGAGALIIGAPAAWLVTFYRFPGRALLSRALILPLAIPPYILAYIYAEMLDYAGPVQSAIRSVGGWQSPDHYAFPEIRSLGGACMIMALALYPYVYIAASAVFARRSTRILHTARLLGQGGARCFFTTALPMARPALAAALALVAMECFNDIGAVEHLGVRTLTAGLYDVWLGRGMFAAGVQIACVMLILIFILIAVERGLRADRRYHLTADSAPPAPRALNPIRAGLAAGACFLPVLTGFLLPVILLAGMSAGHLEAALENGLLIQSLRSLGLAAAAAMIAVIAGLALASAVRNSRGARLPKTAARLAAMGYAVPGAVLALGVFAILPAGQGFAAGAGALIFAYCVRFLALPYGAIDAEFARLPPNLDHAATLMGAGAFTRLIRIHAPQLRLAMGAGAVIVFIETMRELPATLILRPFGFDTLATHIYERASLGLLEESAPAALLLALLGLIPALLMQSFMRNGSGRA